MLAHRNQFAVSVELSRCSCRHSDAQQHGLLQDEHQHAWQDGVAVSAGGVEYRHFIEFQWMGGKLIVSIRETSTFRNLNARVDMACYTLCRLINCLVGKHQTHVAINAHMCLFATVQSGVEVGRNIDDSVHRLLLHQLLRLVETVAVIGGLGIGRGIVVADKLAGAMAVAQVHNRRIHLSHYLVVVNPRVEQRITQRHQDAEDEHTLVAEHIAHLRLPDEAHVPDAIDNLI